MLNRPVSAIKRNKQMAPKIQAKQLSASSANRFKASISTQLVVPNILFWSSIVTRRAKVARHQPLPEEA